MAPKRKVAAAKKETGSSSPAPAKAKSKAKAKATPKSAAASASPARTGRSQPRKRPRTDDEDAVAPQVKRQRTEHDMRLERLVAALESEAHKDCYSGDAHRAMIVASARVVFASQPGPDLHDDVKKMVGMVDSAVQRMQARLAGVVAEKQAAATAEQETVDQKDAEVDGFRHKCTERKQAVATAKDALAASKAEEHEKKANVATAEETEASTKETHEQLGDLLAEHRRVSADVLAPLMASGGDTTEIVAYISKSLPNLDPGLAGAVPGALGTAERQGFSQVVVDTLKAEMQNKENWLLNSINNKDSIEANLRAACELAVQEHAQAEKLIHTRKDELDAATAASKESSSELAHQEKDLKALIKVFKEKEKELNAAQEEAQEFDEVVDAINVLTGRKEAPEVALQAQEAAAKAAEAEAAEAAEAAEPEAAEAEAAEAEAAEGDGEAMDTGDNDE